MKYMMRIVVSMVSAMLLSGLLLASAAAQGNADNVTLCHATGSESNPFVVITVDAAGAFNGHYGTGQGDHQNAEDIIPPFTYQGQQYSQNWDAEGQAIFKNDCVVPGTTPTNPEEPVEELPLVGSGPAIDADHDRLMLTAGLLAVGTLMGGAVLRLTTTRR